jgi:hypothetical protein
LFLASSVHQLRGHLAVLESALVNNAFMCVNLSVVLAVVVGGRLNLLKHGEIFLCLRLSVTNMNSTIFECSCFSGRSVNHILPGPSQNVQLPEVWQRRTNELAAIVCPM